MKRLSRMPSIGHIAIACALVMTESTAFAAENNLRIIPQIMAGTVGVEPGLAFEWRGLLRPSLVFRPEVLINEDGDLGGGTAVLFDLSPRLGLSGRQAIGIGPRVLYHNSNDYGWEADALATWSYDLVGGARAWRHSVGILGAIGVAYDKEQEEDDFAASVGIFYAYGF